MAEISNRSILKTYTSTRKNTFTLVTLPSFSISGVISAEKMSVENYRRLYDWGYLLYPESCKELPASLATRWLFLVLINGHANLW